jgi:hypothetical protein
MPSQSQSSQSSKHRIEIVDLDAEENENQENKGNQAEETGMSDAQEDRLNDDLDSFEAENAVRKNSKKNRNHTVWIMILCVIGVISIAAGVIGSQSSSYNSYSDTNSNYNSESVSGHYSSNPFASVEIEGDTYTFPAKLSDFENNGWTVSATSSDENLPETLDAYSVESVNLTRNGMRMSYVRVENLTDTDGVPLSDATISSLSFSASSDNGFDLTLPYGIQFYESSSDVISTLDQEGAPYEVNYYEGDVSYIDMEYDEGYTTYYFDVYFSNNEVSSVYLDYSN